MRTGEIHSSAREFKSIVERSSTQSPKITVLSSSRVFRSTLLFTHDLGLISKSMVGAGGHSISQLPEKSQNVATPVVALMLLGSGSQRVL